MAQSFRYELNQLIKFIQNKIDERLRWIEDRPHIPIAIHLIEKEHRTSLFEIVDKIYKILEGDKNAKDSNTQGSD